LIRAGGFASYSGGVIAMNSLPHDSSLAQAGERARTVTLRATFDSSKDHPCGVTVVAGYIADATKWQSIEERWNNLLAVERMKRFHLNEIRARYSGDQWLMVVGSFASIAQKAEMRSVSSILKDTDWSSLGHDSEYRKLCPHREHACLDMLWEVLSEDVRLEFNSEPIAIAFDQDWGNRDAVMRLHDAWCKRTDHPGFNIFFKGSVPWDTIPLQCADMAAGLLRLNPFSRSMLDEEITFDSNNPVAEVASIAMPSGRGALWSKAVAERVEVQLQRQGRPDLPPNP
jgi:hypothetical protein